MENGTCTVVGCERTVRVKSRGWCTLHYDRWRATGETGTAELKRVATYAGVECSIEDCSGPATNRGWCDRHYQRWTKHGDPLAGNPSPTVLRALDHEDGTRTCCICGARQALELYDQDQNASLGRRSRCKPCRSDQMKKWYADNQERQASRQRARFDADPDKHRQWDRERYERDREKRLLIAYVAVDRRRARQAGVEFDKSVTRVNLRRQYGDQCFYCQVDMTFTATKRGTGLRPDNLATVEHVHPISLGGPHTWENVVLACWRCNISKGGRTTSEWQSSAAGHS